MESSNSVKRVQLYSDGGADPNPGRGGYGVILVYGDYRKEFCGGYLLTTNNRMELIGVITGLEKLTKHSIVDVYTDSQYVVNGIEKGWAVKWRLNNWYRTKTEKATNYDLWDRLLILVEMHQVKFNWVKGHNGHPENERCDALATFALNSSDLEPDKGFVNKEPIDTSNRNSSIKSHNPLSKIIEAGAPCRKCSVPLEKRLTKNKKPKEGQSYYFEYYFYCSGCKTMYFTEEAKRAVVINNLFG